MNDGIVLAWIAGFVGLLVILKVIIKRSAADRLEENAALRAWTEIEDRKDKIRNEHAVPVNSGSLSIRSYENYLSPRPYSTPVVVNNYHESDAMPSFTGAVVGSMIGNALSNSSRHHDYDNDNRDYSEPRNETYTPETTYSEKSPEETNEYGMKVSGHFDLDSSSRSSYSDRSLEQERVDRDEEPKSYDSYESSSSDSDSDYSSSDSSSDYSSDSSSDSGSDD